MDENTPLQASLRAIKAIEETLQDCAQGIDNPGARHRINDAIKTIRHHFWWFAPAGEKIVSICEMGDALFRPHKHASYGGVEKVRSIVLADCNALESIVRRAATEEGRND